MKSDYDPKSARVIPVSRKNIPKSCRIPFIDASRSNGTNVRKENYLKTIGQALCTFHNYLHITHKTMDHTQCLSNSHPSLILCQSIQSLDSGFYLTVA